MTNSVNTLSFNRTIDKDRFNDFIEANLDKLRLIAPTDPVISKDDEWNDPIYDIYADKNEDLL